MQRTTARADGALFAVLVHPQTRIGDIARRQFGVFTRTQAKACGFSNRMIQYRLESHMWNALHPGVYCVDGTGESWERDQVAAAYWARGPAAGLAAGRLHRLPGCDTTTPEVVTLMKDRAMPHNGVIVHATNRLPPEQVTSVNRIPVTSIERTLLDLCGRLSERDAAIAIDNALSRGLTTVGELDYCLFRTARRGRNGCGRLRRLVQQRASIGVVATTPLETVLFQMFVDHGLPLPVPQMPIFDAHGAFVARPDFVYPKERLVIEAHSRLWHEGTQKRSEDVARDERLRSLAFDVVYVTWPDATRYADRTAALINERLRVGAPELTREMRALVLLS